MNVAYACLSCQTSLRSSARSEYGLLGSKVRDWMTGWATGTQILGHLLLLFINLVMDNPDEDWAMPMYSVIEE